MSASIARVTQAPGSGSIKARSKASKPRAPARSLGRHHYDVGK